MTRLIAIVNMVNTIVAPFQTLTMFRCSKGDGSVDSCGGGNEDAGQIGKWLVSEICRSLSLVVHKTYFNFQRIGP